nr:MAG TPA: intron associated endonuclease [Caudoviricetes sp.]
MIEDTNYTVYKHTTPSGKVYIGITERKPEKRWNNGNGYKNNKHFYSAILKYDWKNIKHEIVENGLTKQQACDKEIELIAKYDATNPCKGYNHSTGGEINKGYHLSPETRWKISESLKSKGTHLSSERRRKLSEVNKCRIPWNKGVHPSAETRRKLSEANKGKHHHSAEALKKMSESKKGVNNPNYGKHPSAESRRKMSESTKGVNHPNYGKHLSAETRRKIGESRVKAVICIETGILYSSCREAAESIAVVKSAIAMCCRGEHKTAGGYHWKYVEM